MKKASAFFLCIFFLLALEWVLISRYFQQQIDQISQEKAACEKKLSQQKPATANLSNAFLLSQKNKVLAEIKKDRLYFTAKPEKISSTDWKVRIYFQGENGAAADAADLRLDYSLAEILSITPGSAFPLYPRNLIAPDHLLITGLASLNNFKVTYGYPGKIFCEILIRVKDGQNNAQISLNTNDTKIFLNGDSILDEQKNFDRLNLN